MGLLKVNDTLKFNLEDLLAQKKFLDDLRNELAENSNALEYNLATLKDDWQSDARDKFFEKIESNWKPHVNALIKMVDDLSNALNDAIACYEPVEEEFSRVANSFNP